MSAYIIKNKLKDQEATKSKSSETNGVFQRNQA